MCAVEEQIKDQAEISFFIFILPPKKESEPRLFEFAIVNLTFSIANDMRISSFMTLKRPSSSCGSGN